jgi:glutamine synthetase
MSVYLGESMNSYLTAYQQGIDVKYDPRPVPLNIGATACPDIIRPAEDRNRTSPFPYGGHRFEFRAVGSSQNVSLVNTVLGTICAKSFKNFADKIEAGASPRAVAEESLKEHFKVVFDGDGYNAANQQMLTERGVWRIDSGVEAMKRHSEEKNMALFAEMNVLSREECIARTEVSFEHYVGIVEVEVKVMIDMIRQNIIPSMRAAAILGPVKELEDSVLTLEAAWDAIHHLGGESGEAKAQAARVLRLETMIAVRKVCDDAEAVCPANMWTLATYKELLFIDQH